jgi:hypothetical protein
MYYILILLFILFSFGLILLSKMFNAQFFILGAAIILTLLALNILTYGYDVQETTFTSSNFTLYTDPVTQNQLITGMNVTRTQLFRPVQDTSSIAWGFIMLGTGAVLGLYGAGRR